MVVVNNISRNSWHCLRYDESVVGHPDLACECLSLPTLLKDDEPSVSPLAVGPVALTAVYDKQRQKTTPSGSHGDDPL